MQKSLTKKLGMTVAAIAMAATGLFTATDAEAVPAFARQTGMTCTSCHFQSFPALNGMGRSFKSGGYTMQGTQPMIEGADLSIPSALNFSIAWKSFYIMKDSGVTFVDGQDELAFLVGGRVNADTGFLFEVAGDAFASTKIHFNITDSFAVVPFATDALGEGYSFELMNTAIQRSQRPLESRKGMMFGHVIDKKSTSGVGLGTGAASGIAFVLTDPSYFVNVSLYSPDEWIDKDHEADLAETGTWIRAAYFFDLAGYDSGVGFGTRGGTANVKGTSTDIEAATYIDFQMQGQMGGNDLGIYFSQSTTDSGSGIGLAAKYSVTPKVQVHFGTSTGSVDDTSGYGYTNVGVDYIMSQNAKILVFNESDAKAGTASTKIGWFMAL